MNLADKTYEAIRQLGWAQGDMATYHDPEDAYSNDPRDISGVCLLGGMGWAVERSPWAFDTTNIVDTPEVARLTAVLEIVIVEQFPDRLGEDNDSPVIVSSFNDHMETTLEDVELVCKKASIRLNEEVI